MPAASASPLPPGWTLRLGSWAALAAGARVVRTEVFLIEQAIPPALEWDEDDASSLHALLCDPQGEPQATARLLSGERPGQARIGRVAVRAPQRRRGLARALLRALMDQARARGDTEIVLAAQLGGAEALYASEGFRPEGAVFDDAGLPHRTMRCRLAR